MRCAVFIGALIVAALTSAADPPRVEQGSPAELRGVTRLYIAAADEEQRRDLASRLKAAITPLEIVDDPSRAEVLLVVTVWTEEVAEPPSAGSTCRPCEAARRARATPELVSRAIATTVRPVGANHFRQLTKFTWSGSATAVLHHQLVQHFATAYRRANRR